MKSGKGYVERRELLDGAGVSKALQSVADSVARDFRDEPLVLVGVRTGGFHLAERLERLLAGQGLDVQLGAVDITLYRDDVFEGLPRPEVGPTQIPCSLTGRTVVLVDDVLFTGRTVRAALDALIDFDRPKAVRLAVLVDRGHRELPIQADYVGLRVATERSESVRVVFGAGHEPERVVLLAREPK